MNMALLSVTVKKARYAGIQAQQYNSYVTLKLQNVKSTTVTVKGSNPCWEQDFLFETNDVNTGLLVEVWSKGMIWDRALGYNYIPLRDIQYSNEEATGQWVSLDAELVMRDGEVVATKTPTGDSLLLDCRFELPFGRYDPPSGWKCLLAPDSQRKSGPRSLRDEDNTDWLPLGRQNLPDHWSGRDAENTVGDALQRKLERLNSTILSQDEQTRRQHQYYGHSGYSEDSDYTSDLNYPIGQHPNSSASQFRSAAQLMRTPDRSLETSRENSYERDDAPNQGHVQGGHRLIPNPSGQQGRISRSYASQQNFRNYNEADGEPLYYNSRPKDFKEYTRRRKKNWDSDESQSYGRIQWTTNGHSNTASRKRVAGRRPSLERQTTLYDDQYYSEQQYYDDAEKQKYQVYGAQNYEDYYSQDYGYQNERYGEEEEDKQWDSGGYYYSDNYADSLADNYQNIVNKMRSSKKLPFTLYSNSSQENAYYTPLRGTSYENDSMDDNAQMSAAARRKLLKQQRQMNDNTSSASGWQSDERSTVWQSAEDCAFYEDYNARTATINSQSATPATTPMHPPKKRTLPQIRASSRIKASAVSLPQIPVRQLPNPIAAVNKQRVSAPVSRTTSADYEQNDVYDSGMFNENYNYAYASNDNLLNEKFGNYPDENRMTNDYLINYETAEKYPENYENKENYPQTDVNYQNTTEQYPNVENRGNSYVQHISSGDYYPGDYYREDQMKGYYDANNLQDGTQKAFIERRSNSPFVQQNTDSLESRDDELRDESFETGVDSICSSVPMQRTGTEYFSMDAGGEYKLEPPQRSTEYQIQQTPEDKSRWQTPSQVPTTTPASTLPSQTQMQQQQQQQQQQPKQQQSTGMLGGLLGQLTKSPSQYLNQQQQGQKNDQRSRDQPNLLSNPALTAMNVTKGLFNSITNAVNNTVQNINKQQKPQQQPQQQAENLVQRIQVTKKGSLKQQESFECSKGFRSQRNSFDSQVQDYMIPEEPEYPEEKEEEEYYESKDKYYEYDEKDYYETRENEFTKETEMTKGMVSELDQLESSLRAERERTRELDGEFPTKRIGYLRHQDTIESEGKRSEMSNRSYLRQQDSLDSCAEEMIMHNSGLIEDETSALDRYEDMRTDGVEPMKNGTVDSDHTFRKRGSGHDNSLIEPYHPSGVVQDIQKDYSSSPPSIQKQQSIDLEGIDEEEVPEDVEEIIPEESDQPPHYEPKIEEPIKVVVPERRKYTAKERWHRAYNIVVQQLNVSFFLPFNYLNFF